MPCDASAPLPTSELKLKAPHDSSDMWIFPRFVVLLEGKRILVPIESLADCSKIREHLQKNAELERAN